MHISTRSRRVGGLRTVLGGMPGWQIALIAIGAALVAAICAVLAYRAWTARRPLTAPRFADTPAHFAGGR